MATNAATRTLTRLYEYNSWANKRVFEVVEDVARGEGALWLAEPAGGTRGSVEETLKHLVGVEDVYLLMLTVGDLPPRSDAELQAYERQGLAWFAARSAEVADGYNALLASADEAFLDAPLRVPWFDFALTRHDGLLQVLAHSAQHRAQVLSALGAQGVDVPDVDYVLMLGNASA